jgi:hypothetical protein
MMLHARNGINWKWDLKEHNNNKNITLKTWFEEKKYRKGL